QSPPTADARLPRTLPPAVLRSPPARARATRLDLEPARRAPGVRGALGPDDLDGLTREPAYRGAGIAAVAADSFAQARAALDAIELEWEVLEPLLDPDEAVRRGSLIGEATRYERGDLDRGLAE